MDLPYRPCVGIMLLNKDNHVFVGQRIDTTSEAWQMPQGGIDEGESPREAVLRELLEETGTNNAEIIAESQGWYHYDLPENLIPKLWGGKYRGQEQKWFVLRFLGADAEINIETDHPEFCEWQWLKASQVPDVIVPFKQELYRSVVAEFKGIIA